MNDYIDEYLSGIGFSKNSLREDKLETLGLLQRQHLYSIPFENIEFNEGKRKK